MPLANLIVIACWIVFVLYWLVAAIGTKKDIRDSRWRRNARNRFLLIIAMLAVLWLCSRWGFSQYRFDQNIQIIGAALCVIGISFAIWARWHLGKNWSGTPSMKEGHELITSGPYTFARHPIYTGMLLAVLGSVLTGGIIWLAVFVVFGIYVLSKIPVEERYMMHLFPDTYPAYKKRTKALIPFVW
jgi:protein-S-isoprenylcysteine O-methyltransferase Ste14